MLAHPPAPPAPRQTVRYGFAGAVMGADLRSWRLSRPKASCGAPAGRSGLVACDVADQPLGGAYAARDLTYLFLDGRLVQIRFRTSIDGFAYAVARLKQEFGQPAAIRRNVIRLQDERAQHVAFDWRNGRSTIELSDPVPPGAQLGVRITLDAAAPTLASLERSPSSSPGAAHAAL